MLQFQCTNSSFLKFQWTSRVYHLREGQTQADPWRIPLIAALTFIAVADGIPAFESLSTQFLQDELPLLASFEKTWIWNTRWSNTLPWPSFLLLADGIPAFETSRSRENMDWNALEMVWNALLLALPVQQTPWRPTTTPSTRWYPASTHLYGSSWTPWGTSQALTANTMQRIQRGCSFRPRPTEAARNTRIVNLITSYTRATADSLPQRNCFQLYVLILREFLGRLNFD